MKNSIGKSERLAALPGFMILGTALFFTTCGSGGRNNGS
jgi:hypothetical protein